MDALVTLEIDAVERKKDAQQNARAFEAIETLADVFAKACARECELREATVIIENLRRLAQIMEDFMAATGGADRGL